MSANRLAREKSPYLLQHAHNPVDWYPWGLEAFEKAAREDKPVFLSIGYSTCHWCHVMEHESFVDETTAKLLNDRFVSIKVDREERPDLDGLYMGFVMAATGSGGWPMSVFLTPDQKPFYGGTYFPPADRYGMPGFKTLLNSIDDAWKNRRGEIVHSAEHSAKFLTAGTSAAPAQALTAAVLVEAVEDFSSNFDAERGGFGGAPKFPRSHALSFLLGESLYAKNARALEIAEKTLLEMARGGLYDQLGGGFHRYSTDAQWRVPHFEKMLYDQALLARTYVDAYRLTRKKEYERIARETLEYVLRDLTDPAGGFYSAEDADSADPDDSSHKREGAFFVWTKKEIEAALGPERAAVFMRHYGVEEKGNAITDPHQEFTNRNVLYLAHPDEPDTKLLVEGRQILFEARAKRPRPHRDDKVLADWNGLMIGAFAEAARAFDEPRYLEAARRAAEFIETRMTEDGKLSHRWREGEKAIAAFLTDEAFLASGYLLLYEAGGDGRWLGRARQLADDIQKRFSDSEKGAFYVSAHDGEAILARSKEFYDGAVPSGNTVAAHLFYRLWEMTGNQTDRKTAERTLEAFSGQLAANPSQYPQGLIALRLGIGPAREVVLAGEPEDAAFRKLARETGFSFSPNQVTLIHRSGAAGATLEALAPFTAGMTSVDGRPAAYVCVNRACRLPLTDAERLKQVLEEAPHS